jgi:hypothetical protein
MYGAVLAKKGGGKMPDRLEQTTRKILQSDLLRQDDYTLHELIQIRDALYILDKYNLADIDLLREVEKYLEVIRERCPVI